MTIETGSYLLKHPLLMLIRPKLHLYSVPEKKKTQCNLQFLHRKKELMPIKQMKDTLFFQFYLDIFPIDLVLQFYSPTAFKGFIDTPIGHFNFTGRKYR